jgi:hypothetical protein
MPVCHYLDLSTAHLTQPEADELCGLGPTGQYVMDDLEHSPRVVAHEYGAWVNVPTLLGQGGSWSEEDTEALESSRPNLAACITRARALDCTWINFDQDAERDPELPTFDW